MESNVWNYVKKNVKKIQMIHLIELRYCPTAICVHSNSKIKLNGEIKVCTAKMLTHFILAYQLYMYSIAFISWGNLSLNLFVKSCM